MDRKAASGKKKRAIWKSKSLKIGMVGALSEVQIAKICTTPARDCDLEVKIVKSGMVGPLLEIEVAQICTTPARESDLEAKIVKIPGSWTNFLRFKVGSKCFSCGRLWDFDTASSYKSLKRIVIPRSSVCSTCHISGKSRRTLSVSQSVKQLVR